MLLSGGSATNVETEIVILRSFETFPVCNRCSLGYINALGLQSCDILSTANQIRAYHVKHLQNFYRGITT